MAELKGGERAQAALDELARKLTGGPLSLRVGFLEDAKYDDGTPVATVAAIDNFGAPARGIPPRPFFSDMIKAHAAEWGGNLGAILEATDNDAGRALNLLGLHIAGQLQTSIRETNGPPNSPVTNLLKQRFPTRDGMTFADVLQAWHDVAAGNDSAPAGKPLVWSGKMLESVRSEVV